jgi:L-lactate dehydrogenase complex protein LldF
VKINIPHMLIGLRELQHSHRKSRLEALAYRLSAQVLSRPWLYRLALGAARVALRPFARGGWIRRLPGAGGNWTRDRDFPAPAAQPFRARWRNL